jgi:hypothetical protein
LFYDRRIPPKNIFQSLHLSIFQPAIKQAPDCLFLSLPVWERHSMALAFRGKKKQDERRHRRTRTPFEETKNCVLGG